MKRHPMKLIQKAVFLTFMALSSLAYADPIYKTDLDTQHPNRDWEIRYLRQGTTPTIAFDMEQDGQAYTNLSGYGFTLHLWTNATDATSFQWASTAVASNRVTFKLNNTCR